MGHIFGNLKPYWKSVIIIILLLVVQAVCDLSLPAYTSDIIDVGIQKKGIDHIIPEKITKEDYAQAEIFMEKKEKKRWESLYQEDGDLYVRKKADNDKLDAADEELLIPLVLNYQMGHMEEEAFRKMAISFLSENPQMKDYVSQAESMSAKELSEMMQVPIDFFEAEDEDGVTKTYVNIRPFFRQLTENGQMTPQMLQDSKKQMQKMVDQIGSSTLKSMGVLFAVECDENAGVDVDGGQISYLWITGGKMALIAILMLLASIAVSFFASRVGAGVGRDLREKVFDRVMAYSNAEIDKFSSASLITRATNDVQQIQMVTAMILRMALYAPIIGVGGIIKVAESGADMGWIIFLAVGLILAFVMVLMAIAMPKFKIMQTMVDNLNRISREILTGLSVIRAFGREKLEEERFDAANTDLKKTQLFTNRVMTFMMPGMMMIMNCIVVLITWTSAKHIDDGTLQVGTMTAFITYTMLIVISFLMITAMSIFLPRAGVAAGRIHEVLSTETSILEKEQPKAITSHNGVLKFDHVSFRYPGAEEDVLEDLSFTAEPGKVTAIIGSTGCGKSTLVNLIPRFYDVTDGAVTLDGVDIRELSLKELRQEIGFVPQKGVLFSGSIAYNLRFGAPDLSEEQMEEAAEIAQAAEFINEKKEGYESYIAQGGNNVSGGQKQRLAIARAVAKDPRIYVFDDSFSALDMKTDAALRAALQEHVKDRTQIIVAQRISTILYADQILVLDEGKIVGKGTHEELLKDCEVYREIAESQLSQKELGLSEKQEAADAAQTQKESGAEPAQKESGAEQTQKESGAAQTQKELETDKENADKKEADDRE